MARGGRPRPRPEGSIAVGDHILEINGVETGTLSEPISKLLPINPRTRRSR